MTAEIELFRDRKKSRNLFLKTTALCLVLAIVAAYSLGVFDQVLKVKLAVGSGVLLVIMLVMLISALLRLKDRSPLVTLNAKGISGTTTPLSKAFGEIAWTDVTDIYLHKVSGDTLVAFMITPHPKYEGRLSKAFRSMAYQKEANQYVIMFTASEIETDAEKLFELANQYWKANMSL